MEMDKRFHGRNINMTDHFTFHLIILIICLMSSNRSVTGSFPIHILLFVECFTSRFDLNRLEKNLFSSSSIYDAEILC